MRTLPLALAAGLVPFLSGCVVVSMHSTRVVKVHVTDRATEQPVGGAEVSCGYSYDSYGVYYVLRMPEACSALTDSNGVALLPMATFGKSINFSVDGHRYEVTRKLIRRGGFVRGEYYWRDPDAGGILRTNLTPLVIQLIPEN